MESWLEWLFDFFRKVAQDRISEVYSIRDQFNTATDIKKMKKHLNMKYADEMIAYIKEDELLEVTPKNLRLRKRFLIPHERKKAS